MKPNTNISSNSDERHWFSPIGHRALKFGATLGILTVATSFLRSGATLSFLAAILGFVLATAIGFALAYVVLLGFSGRESKSPLPSDDTPHSATPVQKLSVTNTPRPTTRGFGINKIWVMVLVSVILISVAFFGGRTAGLWGLQEVQSVVMLDQFMGAKDYTVRGVILESRAGYLKIKLESGAVIQHSGNYTVLRGPN